MDHTPDMTAQEIAEKAAQTMWASDHASAWFGMSLDAVSTGAARLSLSVQEHHCNGHGICHGAVSFALADSAFAFACNSYNQRTVGQHNMVSYLRPIFKGDTITAHASEVSRSTSSGIYDVRVVNQKGQTCVEMRGFSRRIDGQLFEP